MLQNYFGNYVVNQLNLICVMIDDVYGNIGSHPITQRTSSSWEN